ncbi:AbgT family transporter [Streptomyces sp. RFCAC02]|uniref:AbgT family transporter n=1 Tax=Streptomyces sp. RFCAC02 TaxID=2499143 RepID=UPI0010216E01|nr:AbgT family transporter [Streptomyces sp. RFCAC02]
MQETLAQSPGGSGGPGPGGTSLLDRVLGGIERAGNRLPHPFFLFCGLFVLLAAISSVLAAAGADVTVPGSGETLEIKGLFTGEGLQWLLENLVPNFTGFPSLGTVMLMMMAVGVAERSGLLETVVRATIARAPARFLPYVVAFVACQGHVMSDISILVIPPLAALAFRSAGRNPVAGLIGGFACTCAGYAAGFVVGSLDALYVGITEQATAVLPMGADSPTHILVNYFFTAVASALLGLLGGFLIDKVLEPRLPEPEADPSAEFGADGVTTEVTAIQRRGLLWAGLVLLVYAVIVIGGWLIPGSPLRGEGGALVPSPLLSGVIPVLFVAFLVCGVVYGAVVKTVAKPEDVPRMMGESVTSMSSYIVLIFAIAQVIAVFNWSNVGTLLAVKCAAGLESIGLTGFTGIVLFVLLVTLLNLFITSGSALWSLMAPVFVPTFMLLGMEPALTQAAFRIGDSATQMITPMNPYLFLTLALLRRYEPSAQLGTLLSRLSIFVVPYLIAWLAVLGIFYGFDIPLGPGADIHMP